MASRFDEHATTYTDEVDAAISFAGISSDPFLRRKAALALSLVDGVPRALLDFGCGVGNLAALLRPQVMSLTGVDISARSLDEARRRVPDTKFVLAEPDTVPVPAESFDLAVASCVFHHIDAELHVALATHIRSALMSDAPFVIFEHNPFNPLTRLAVNRCEFDDDAVLLRAKAAATMLHSAGFRSVEVRHIFFLPWERSWVDGIEFRLRRVPFGAQYMAIGRA